MAYHQLVRREEIRMSILLFGRGGVVDSPWISPRMLAALFFTLQLVNFADVVEKWQVIRSLD